MYYLIVIDNMSENLDINNALLALSAALTIIQTYYYLREKKGIRIFWLFVFLTLFLLSLNAHFKFAEEIKNINQL